MSEIEKPLLIGIREAARLLNLSTRSIHRLHQSGKLPKALAVCGKLLWRRSELERWIEAGAPTLAEWNTQRSEGGV
jgi:excisionase family DNA binding protein